MSMSSFGFHHIPAFASACNGLQFYSHISLVKYLNQMFQYFYTTFYLACILCILIFFPDRRDFFIMISWSHSHPLKFWNLKFNPWDLDHDPESKNPGFIQIWINLRNTEVFKKCLSFIKSLKLKSVLLV